MSKLSRRGFAAFAAAFAFVLAGISVRAQAQQKPVIKVSSLTLPVFNPLVWNVMKARGFDAKHGFELDIHAYPSIAAFYAGFATGETDALIGGPTIFQKLYQEGVPVRIIGTGFTLADLVIFAKDPAIKSLADLKGKQLAIDMGGSQYQVVKIYAAAKGIDLGKDITVVNANFARRPRAARGRPRRRGAGDRAAGQHQRQAASRLARHLQRRARAGRRSPAKPAGRSCRPCAPTPSREIPNGAEDAARRPAGRRRRCSRRKPPPPTRSPTRR